LLCCMLLVLIPPPLRRYRCRQHWYCQHWYCPLNSVHPPPPPLLPPVFLFSRPWPATSASQASKHRLARPGTTVRPAAFHLCRAPTAPTARPAQACSSTARSGCEGPHMLLPASIPFSKLPSNLLQLRGTVRGTVVRRLQVGTEQGLGVGVCGEENPGF
jgi:hypothetical protein